MHSPLPITVQGDLVVLGAQLGAGMEGAAGGACSGAYHGG